MLEISLVILSGAFLLFVLFCIPFLLQIWRSARNISVSLETLNRSLPEIMKNLEGITANLNHTTRVIDAQVEGLSLYVQRFQGVLAVLAEAESLLRGRLSHPVVRSLATAAAVTKGFQAFWRVLRAPGERSAGNQGALSQGGRGSGA